jgi:Holliday junction DNA helicase RuvA
MIGRLTGILLEKNPPAITVDVHGLGYEVDVPMSTFYNLPASGEKVTLFTHLAIREDGHFLYGFGSVDERAAFRQLLKISGVGARTALAVLSGMSVNELAQAIALQEAGRLTKIPGIGKKTAERLLLELRDKLPKAFAGSGKAGAGGTAPDARTDHFSDILNALLALGYNEREALGAMKELAPDAAVSDGIRQALKRLSKAG